MIFVILIMFLAGGLLYFQSLGQQTKVEPTPAVATSSTPSATPLKADVASSKTAMLAGGCFWCVESDFEKLAGVVGVVSGYAGGTGVNPTYSDYGSRGYREVVEVTYDPAVVSYANLVEYLIKHSDPTDPGGSFYDRGLEYSPAVYYQDESERLEALRIISLVEAKKIYDKPIAISVVPNTNFWPAEEYHQDYYIKNPIRYSYYRRGSGRDAFIKKHWGTDLLPNLDVKVENEVKVVTSNWQNFMKPNDTALRAQLTPLQYKVTQEDGTEPPFKNEYDTNKREGIYVDIVSGEPLYSSRDKYDSGTGWPSFVKPIAPNAVVEEIDKGIFSTRTEIRSRIADSHLGHVFTDGPVDRGGLRYCMNSAALRFVPKEEMEKAGYGEYLELLN